MLKNNSLISHLKHCRIQRYVVLIQSLGKRDTVLSFARVIIPKCSSIQSGIGTLAKSLYISMATVSILKDGITVLY